MTWNRKRVLVTGGGGFIASHLAERLVELGAQVRAMTHYRSNGSRGWLDDSPHKNEMEIIAGDICDRDCVAQAARDREIIFHLAAIIAIPYSYHAPFSYVRTNIEGTLNILQTAKRLELERVVHTSTSEVYGTARSIPIHESHPLQGQSPYAASKIGADKMVEAFHLSYGLPVVTVRPFNTFGPRQSARAIIPTIIAQCLAGSRVRLGNLSPTRDMNYVSDIVEGFILAAVSSKAVGRVVNLGSGREMSIENLAKMIASISKRDVVIKSDPERKRPKGSEVERLLADNTAARQLLGWKPSVPLEEGLRLTLEWMRKHLDQYRPGVYVL